MDKFSKTRAMCSQWNLHGYQEQWSAFEFNVMHYMETFDKTPQKFCSSTVESELDYW